ncbi:hypothetical protein [Ensifer sesbaniae]|uniref:hypothetical protein n=1 Tax=Ensifer sesbaniae TaxID=1214071 RepID=UPI001568CEA5|nr:hypothetical protein [Ensifer sesbaniae]NRQ15582.1 hypothetical protein [Ensifer sesbaniae]
MAIERATKKTTKATRSVTLPGKRAAHMTTDPVDIARELRAKSRLGQREAKLAAAEEKLK